MTFTYIETMSVLCFLLKYISSNPFPFTNMTCLGLLYIETVMARKGWVSKQRAREKGYEYEK